VEPAEFVEPAAAAETLPAAEEIGWEEESPWQPAPAEEEAATPEMAPEEAATEELAWEAPVAPEAAPDLASPWEETAPLSSTAEGDLEEGEPEMETPSAGPEATLIQPAEEIVSLEEEIPGVDLAGEVVAAEAPPQPVPQQEAPVPQPAPQAQAGRGVFDTETLASIYINQGFYGRAAAIYERLAAGNPEDEGLRRKLEEVRALERAQAVQEGEGEEPAAGGQAGRSDRAETIRRLEALLEAFRGGRPR